MAVIGRPNVGKSTLINRLLGENRMVAFDQPGTTRDAVLVPFERDGERYTLDRHRRACGAARASRRRSRNSASSRPCRRSKPRTWWSWSWMRTTPSPSKTRACWARSSSRAGRWCSPSTSGTTSRTEQRDLIRQQIEQRLQFADFAPLHFISARHGSGVGELFAAVRKVYAAAMRDMSTPELTRVLEAAIESHQPPLVSGRRIKLRYAHQGGRNPPVIVIHGNQTDHVPDAYRRYLVNVYRKAFDLDGHAGARGVPRR